MVTSLTVTSSTATYPGHSTDQQHTTPPPDATRRDGQAAVRANEYLSSKPIVLELVLASGYYAAKILSSNGRKGLFRHSDRVQVPTRKRKDPR